MQSNYSENLTKTLQGLLKLNQEDGDLIISYLISQFSMEELTALSSFFHEICKEKNKKGLLDLYSNFR